MENILNNLLTTQNNLQDKYKEIFINSAIQYDTLQEINTAFERGEFSCSTGSICELIYYTQTEEIFKNNFNEVFELIEEIENEYGEVNCEINANSFIWATFEFMVTKWNYEIEEYLQEN